jgi:hypothetical protein
MIEDIELEWLLHILPSDEFRRHTGAPAPSFASIVWHVRDALRVDAERAERVPEAIREDAAERLGLDADSLPERLEALDAAGQAWLVATLDRKMKEDDERGGPLLSLDG